jgi:hypothetical protein
MTLVGFSTACDTAVRGYIPRKLSVIVSLLALLAVFAAPVESVAASINAAQNSVVQPSVLAPWKRVGEGIDYAEFYLPAPNHIYVARMERADPQVTIDSSIAQGALGSGLETVREMAARYDQAINFWDETWGARNQVVVAINGFFYDPETAIPFSGQVQSAWYAKRFDDRQSGSGFAWTLDQRAFIGGCVVHNRNRQIVNFMESGDALQFETINLPLEESGLAIYTPQFGANSPGLPGSVEVLVELSRPLMILPAPAMITGTVRTVLESPVGTPIPFDSIVLSAAGEAASKLRSLAIPGAQVGVSQELRHFQPDCRTPNPQSWEKTYAGIGVSFVFLRDGAIQRFEETAPILRSPRTAVAFNDRYIFFIVVDGRDPFQSLGMSMVELAVFARNTLGATWGAALDGGGSSTMVVNGRLKNHPNTEVDDPNVASGQVERAVANGLMMVVVQPRQQSGRFTAGLHVITLNTALVRLGPGTNYAAFANLQPGSVGVILNHPLNGVLAKGSYWWKVAIGDIEGWVSEDLLNPMQ